MLHNKFLQVTNRGSSLRRRWLDHGQIGSRKRNWPWHTRFRRCARD